MSERWDKRHLAVAQTVADGSKDPSTKVGAVIADANNRLVSTGYNGFPRGVRDTLRRLRNRETRLKMTMHAEKNAILFARRDLTGCSIYSTFIPCAQCAAMIIQAGITRVVTYLPPRAFAERWKDDIRLAMLMFREAGVKVEIRRSGT